MKASEVGETDGRVLGETDGPAVGPAVGAPVGVLRLVGCAGPAVGLGDRKLFVGDDVGPDVGPLVGVAVAVVSGMKSPQLTQQPVWLLGLGHFSSPTSVNGVAMRQQGRVGVAVGDTVGDAVGDTVGEEASEPSAAADASDP